MEEDLEATEREDILDLYKGEIEYVKSIIRGEDDDFIDNDDNIIEPETYLKTLKQHYKSILNCPKLNYDSYMTKLTNLQEKHYNDTTEVCKKLK